LIQHQAFSSAIEVLTPAASHFPKSGKIRTLLGIAHYAYGDSREAVITLEDAITVEPQLDAAYDCLAQVVLQSSAAAPERSFELLCGWNQVVCAALKLRVGHESGDVAAQEAAIAELERSANNDAIGQCELARGLEWTNELEKARKQMERCVSLDPSAQNHYRLALVYQRLGLTDLARKELDSRKQLLQNMSEQTALGLSALRGLGQTMQPAPAIH
jgi:tetratricopeptide (TPR) repeat protein